LVLEGAGRERLDFYRLGARTRFVVERQLRGCLPVDEAAQRRPGPAGQVEAPPARTLQNEAAGFRPGDRLRDPADVRDRRVLHVREREAVALQEDVERLPGVVQLERALHRRQPALRRVWELLVRTGPESHAPPVAAVLHGA